MTDEGADHNIGLLIYQADIIILAVTQVSPLKLMKYLLGELKEQLVRRDESFSA